MVLNTTKTEGCTWYLSIYIWYATCKNYIVSWYVWICLNALELPAKPNIHITYHSVPCMAVPVTLTNHGADKMNLTNFASNVFVWVNPVFWNPEKKTNLLGIIMGGKSQHQVSGKFIMFIPSMWSGRLMEMFFHTGHVPPNCQVMEFWCFRSSKHSGNKYKDIPRVQWWLNGVSSFIFWKKNTPPHRLDQ